MKFESMSTLLLLIFLPLVLAIFLFIVDRNTKKSKTTKYSIIAQIGLLLLSTLFIVKGNVVNYGRSANIDNGGETITIKILHPTENYVQQVKVIGDISLKKIKSTKKNTNRSVEVSRNLLFGTKIISHEKDNLSPMLQK